METQFINSAISIGNSICRDAIRHNGQCNWIGAENDVDDNKPKPYYSALKSNWYNGTSGIAWFLAQLYDETSEKRYQIIALEAIEQALQNAHKIEFGKLGFHSGLTGIAFAAIDIGEKLGKDYLVDQGVKLLHSFSTIAESEFTLDIIDGCAGAIPALIRIQKTQNDPILNSLIHRMGEFLLNKAQSEKSGISWNTLPGGSAASLTGYAHGAAGISSALLELHNYFKEDRYEKAALDGFAYEESCFDPVQENWPDFREFSTPHADHNASRPCGNAWCHGAPGIGLSRLRAYQITGKEEFKKSAQIAIQTTKRSLDIKMLGNYSLCHGLFGNADLLQYGAEVFNDSSLTMEVKQLAIAAIEKYESHKIPFPNGTQSDFNSPDMMLGQAGIGYGFLRLIDPMKFRSILLIH